MWVKLKKKTFEIVVVALMMVVLSLSFIVFILNNVATMSEEDVMVGAYYYIWWGVPFNNHWKQGVGYTPFSCEYTSSDQLTADRHILWAKQHGIDFFAVSWVGKGTWVDWVNETADHTWDFDEIDYNLENGLLKASHIQNFKFCLFYETKLVLENTNIHDKNFTEVFINDMVYAAEEYLVHPSYLRVDGKPVLFIYNLPYLHQNLTPPEEARGLFHLLRQRLASIDINVYLVGDVGGGPSPNNVDSTWLDSMNATTSYFFSDASKGWKEILEDAESYYPKWRSEMNSKGIKFIPNAYPGFDNTEHLKWQGKASQGTVLPPNETMFKKMLTTALNYVDNNLKTVMITSWNEWLESTAIEPSMEFGESFLHTVLDSRRVQQPYSIMWDVFYFAVGAASGGIIVIFLYHRESLRKSK